MAALDHPNFPACLFYERSVDQRQSVHELVTREERDNAFAYLCPFSEHLRRVVKSLEIKSHGLSANHRVRWSVCLQRRHQW